MSCVVLTVGWYAHHDDYGQVLMKCKEKLFVTFNKSYNVHFKNFEDFWLDEEEKRREKWKELWDLNEKITREKDDTSDTKAAINSALNNVFNNVATEKGEMTDTLAKDTFNKAINEMNVLEKKNFRIRLSSQLFDEKEFDQLFIERKKICCSSEEDILREKIDNVSLEEKKERDKKTCLYVERKEEEDQGAEWEGEKP
ncbi:conserved Plasmodium protein, unknown function [Plasmodium ovale wallikeri]|uniref:Uncharacterized protein n=1 Tax=Plasmodium ovale wallikeri TaxID=864142 RepID=A0A1A8YW77_PLAOA|nr:conserved Plasmodium protein, unknown function [Plasmodium ovale wallikeri]SBT35895.1 conserved Plasmodium protein, unknown function [Plasmodium ovale wallikeri]